MDEIVVDPFLLCLPNPCNSAEQLENFIESLLAWRGIIERKKACLLLSDAARIALEDDGEYPHHYRLSQLLWEHQCDIADDKTISKLAKGILEKTPSFEDYFGVNSVLIDEATIRIDPNLIFERLKINCRTALIETLSAISIINETASETGSIPVIIASGFGKEKLEPSPVEIQLEVVVHDVSLAEDKNLQLNLPFNACARIPISFCHKELLNKLGVLAVWNNAEDDLSIVSAIEVCIDNLINSGLDGESRIQFTLGINFTNSVRNWGVATRSDYAMVVIESCARIVLGTPKNPVNEFREDSKSTSKQRKRDDGSLAFRTHLTKKGAGLRLMYWLLPSGSIEFANIGDKDELEIL